MNQFTKFEKDEIEQSIASRFEKQVSMFSDRVAIKTDSTKISYSELNKIANTIAHAILSELGEAQESVSLLFEHGPLAIAAILGILKAGKIYVPLDPSYPLSRLEYMLKDSQSSLLVTNNKSLSLARDLSQNRIPILNFHEIDTNCPSNNININVSPDRLACILYTSGSTGKPKGVVDNHRNVLHNMMIYTNGLRICSQDRLTLFHSCSFGASRLDIFGGLLNGAAIYPLDLKQENNFSLTSWLSHENITLYHSTPTVFRNYLNAPGIKESFDEIRILHLGSEPVYKKDVEFYKKYFPQNCAFVNRLGTTETGTVRLYFINKNTRIDGDIVPAGYPVDDTEILILDDEGKNIHNGDVGEIGIKSRFLSPGYWNKPELTKAAFLPDPQGGEEMTYLTGDLGYIMSDGCLMLLGRKDSQTKIRGHRTGTKEIEMALWALDYVKSAAVISKIVRNGNQRLIAYIVPSDGNLPTVNKIRQDLSKKLPDYMIPSVFVKIDSLPMTSNGKINREKLPEPSTARPNLENPFIPPQTPIEKVLANIWSEVLRLERVGIHDNFFEIGGDSIFSIQIVAKANKAGIKITPKQIFLNQTITELARAASTKKNIIQNLAQEFMKALQSIVQHCKPGDKSYKSSDLSDVDLTQEKLDDILAQINQAGDKEYK